MSKDVIWSVTTAFYSRANNDISANVSGNDWIAFLDAMGWMENSGKYGGISKKGFAGMYQCDEINLGYYHFLNGVGKQFLGVTTKRQFADNPIAQDLAAIMEFSGMPKVTIIDPPSDPFSSVYLAVRSNARDKYKLSTAIFDQLIGKTITISFTGEGTETITLTKAGISSAAHLVGAGKMAEVIYKIYDQCFSAPDEYGNVTQTSSTATFPREGFADGNNVAFSTYVRLLQGYDISSLLNANNLTDFNALVQELMTHRKDKIISDMTSKKQETAMSVSYSGTDYRETVRAIMLGLNLPTDNLNAVDGQVVLVGAANTKYTDKADLIFGLNNAGNILTSGKGNDTLYGGAGDDLLSGGEGNDIMYGNVGDDVFFGGEGNDTMYGGTDNDVYFIAFGDGEDTIQDKLGNNKIYLCGKEINFFYDVGNGTYKSPDGSQLGEIIAGELHVTGTSGTKVILNENFQWGDFGTTLIDLPEDPNITDVEYGTDGADYFYAGFNRKIFLYGGDDIVTSDGNGADWILGGDSNDMIACHYSSSSIVEGGAGSDIIIGGWNGNNQLFGENRGDGDIATILATHIADGETAPDSGLRGDIVAAAGENNDYLFGLLRLADPHFSLFHDTKATVVFQWSCL